MPVYNAEKHLAEAIESILNQTYIDFELLIVNDSSTDSSEHIIQTYTSHDPRIKVFNNEHEKGIAGALNTAIKHAQGRYIARADADDILHHDRFVIEKKFLDTHPNISIVGSGYTPFNSKKVLKSVFHASSSLSIAWASISNTQFCHPSIMFRKKIVPHVGTYSVCVAEDFNFFSRVLKTEKGFNIKKSLLEYRVHEENYSNTHKKSSFENVKQIALTNYTEARKTSVGFEEFFNFQYWHILPLSKKYSVTVSSFKILNSISNRYSIKKYSWQYISTVFYILKLLSKAQVKYMLGYSYEK